MRYEPALNAREMRDLSRSAVIEVTVGEHLAAAVDEEPRERIGPNEPRIAPADRGDEPASTAASVSTSWVASVAVNSFQLGHSRCQIAPLYNAACT